MKEYTLYRKVPLTPRMEEVISTDELLDCFQVLPHHAIASVAFLTDVQLFKGQQYAEYVIWKLIDFGVTVEIFSCKVWLPEIQ